MQSVLKFEKKIRRQKVNITKMVFWIICVSNLNRTLHPLICSYNKRSHRKGLKISCTETVCFGWFLLSVQMALSYKLSWQDSQTYTGSVALMGMLDNVIMSTRREMLISNSAFMAGSSKHGKACRAWVASNWVLAIHLQHVEQDTVSRWHYS